jgi:hypothetical protein
VHENPEPTEEEQEQPPERIAAEEGKAAPGRNDDPESVEPEDRG